MLSQATMYVNLLPDTLAIAVVVFYTLKASVRKREILLIGCVYALGIDNRFLR